MPFLNSQLESFVKSGVMHVLKLASAFPELGSCTHTGLFQPHCLRKAAAGAVPRPGDASHLSLQEKVETQRQRFRLEFEKYRGFLAQEEQLQLRRLEQEERATLQRLREGQRQLAQRGRTLQELARELEGRCRLPALDLLEVRSQRAAALTTPRKVHPRTHQKCMRITGSSKNL